MRSKALAAFLTLLAALISSTYLFSTKCIAQEGSYLVELANDQTLTANDCVVEEGQLHLVYPVGEAYIPISAVKSVKYNDTECLSMLQSEGRYIPPSKAELDSEAAKASASPSTAQSATRAGTRPQPWRDGKGPGLRHGTPAAGGADAPIPPGPDNSTRKMFSQSDKEVDKFIDDVFNDRLTDEEIEKKLDELTAEE